MNAYTLLHQFLEVANLEEQQKSDDFGHSTLVKEMIKQKAEAFSINFDNYVKNLSCPKPAAEKSIWRDL